MKILVNQVGYQAGSLVRAILMGRAGESLPEVVTLRDSDDRIFGDFPAGEYEIVDGWTDRGFRVVEFSAIEGASFTLEAVADDGHTVVSAPFRVGPMIEARELVSNLLFGITTLRSIGASDEADRSVPFFGARDGVVDAHGGWYDASGDTSKYLSHLSYANYMNPQQTPLVVWALLDSRDKLEAGVFPLEDRLNGRLQEEAAWGADFLMRLQDASGYFYMTVFDQWSKKPENRQICTYETQEGVLSEQYQAAYRQGGGMAVAALARAASLPESVQSDFSRSEYLEAAVKGWRHLEEHNTEYLDDGTENIIDDTCALMAACELVIAGVEEARRTAYARVRALTERWNDTSGFFRADQTGEWSWFHASDEALPLIALLRAGEAGLSDRIPGDLASRPVGQALEREYRRCTAVSNPFLHPRRLVRMPGREDSEQFFYPHENPSGYWWQGENGRLASWAAAIRRYLPTVDRSDKTGEQLFDSLSRFADAQISWILGLNPFDACMMQGQGRNNPPYEWDHFNVPGAVANGITSGFTDENDIAFMPPEAAGGGDHAWRWGEQWIPHAAWLLLAVSWAQIPPE